jgi:hypothetical protein
MKFKENYTIENTSHAKLEVTPEGMRKFQAAG